MASIALLRGINVGGHKIIKMADLKQHFENFGLKDVKTFIQSGNVRFEAPSAPLPELELALESHLQHCLGYRVPIFLRTLEAIKTISETNPFQTEGITHPHTKHYVTFLKSTPQNSSLKNTESATFELGDQHVWVQFDKTKSNHPFSNNWVEKEFKTLATTRDWTTLGKMVKAFL